MAGTREARAVAVGLQRARIPAVASFAGVTRAPELPDIPSRIGGFGGEAAFEAYLAEAKITHIIDATHPFATRISARVARVAPRLGLSAIHVLRAPWRPGPGDHWTQIATEEEAAAHLRQNDRVFLATGRQTLARFANLAPRPVFCRQIDPPRQPFPFPGGEFVVARPPFSETDEIALFKRLAIDALIVKNAGGAMSATKLAAARALGMPVIMIKRPPPPKGRIVETAEEALAWIGSQSA